MYNIVYRNLLDEELMHRIATKQDVEAFTTLYKRYAHLAMGVGLKYLSAEVSKDIVQNVFVKLWTDAAQHEIRNFKPWLYTVVRNECLMHLRKKNPETPLFENNGLDFMEMEELTHHKLEQEQMLVILENCLQHLKEDQKNCIEQFYIHQKTYAEIATESGYEEKKVKSNIQNGRRNLKICFENNNS